ncbi:MAG TPA: NAD-dependent epimerase/dehydratase family protein, partial [Acetobacteraceae bacterium]
MLPSNDAFPKGPPALPPAPTLVTGATGFVGSAVARTLLARG